MGFIKRLLSLGGKKNKKDSRPHIVHNVPVPELPWSQSEDAPIISNEEEHEAAVGRLLRSSSARFAESTELDYANLPPLPHPINNVIQTPASSSLSIASTTLTRQGTYNVTVHKRRRHASTEVPVPPLPNSTGHDNDAANKPANKKRKSLLTADDSRVLRLRSDPSVASLLSLYDDHGKLAADAFSNDTPREKRTSKSAPTTMNMRPQPKIEPLRTGDEDRERAQVKRSGSTLRQLLGASTSSDPNNNNPDNSGSGEGDISWAERFLAETESASSHSSIGPETPITAHSTHFYTEPLKGGGDSFSDLDASTVTIDNPAISSMEVEFSATSDMLPDMDESMHGETVTSKITNTPRRASQVFDFLTRGKQSTAVEKVIEDANMSADASLNIALERTLPELPSCFSSPSSDDHHGQGAAASKFKFADPPTFAFAPTVTITEDEDDDDTHKGLRVAPPALPDNTPRPVRHHNHQRSNSTNVHANNYATTRTTHQRSESQDLRSTFSDDSHIDINVNHDNDNAFASSTVPFTPLVNRAAHPNTFTHVDNTVHEDQVYNHDDATNGDVEKKNDIKVMLNGPTKVIVTAPTPGFNPSGPGRLPRGPRAPPSKSSAAMERRRSALVERSNSHAHPPSAADAWSPNRRRERSGSQSSNASAAGSGSSGAGAGHTANVSISDPFTLGHPRRRANTAHAAAQRARSPSTSSVNSFTRALRGEREERGHTIREKEQQKERLRAREQEKEKENHGQPSKRSRSPLAFAKSTLGLSVKTELPATPMRSQSTGSRALLKTVVQQAIAFHPPLPPTSSPARSRHASHFDARYGSKYDQDQDVDNDTVNDKHLHGSRHTRTPSPASSSEMSPVGRQIMLDVRQQRLNARQAERERAATRRGGSERRPGYGL